MSMINNSNLIYLILMGFLFTCYSAELKEHEKIKSLIDALASKNSAPTFNPDLLEVDYPNDWSKNAQSIVSKAKSELIKFNKDAVELLIESFTDKRFSIVEFSEIYTVGQVCKRVVFQRINTGGSRYKIRNGNPKFIGMISQRYRPRSGRPAAAFQRWIDEIVARISNHLLPILDTCDMSVSRGLLERAIPDSPHIELAQISDFNSLIAKSQECSTAVFALTGEQLEAAGAVLEGFEASRDAFREIFEALATKVEALVFPDSG